MISIDQFEETQDTLVLYEILIAPGMEQAISCREYCHLILFLAIIQFFYIKCMYNLKSYNKKIHAPHPSPLFHPKENINKKKQISNLGYMKNSLNKK